MLQEEHFSLSEAAVYAIREIYTALHCTDCEQVLPYKDYIDPCLFSSEQDGVNVPAGYRVTFNLPNKAN